MRELIESFIKFITSRLFILSVGIIALFSIMIVRLFDLQIVKGEEYQNSFKGSILRDLNIEAPRGTIYDAYSRPLAINDVAFAVKIDSSISNTLTEEEKNNMYMNLIRLLEQNGDTIIDELPISTTKPYTFLFGGNVEREVKWKVETANYKKGIDSTYINSSYNTIKKAYLDKVIEINSSVTAEDMLNYFRDYFKIDTNLSDEDARKLISLRYSIFLKRFYQYQPITIAIEVSDRTVAILEEKNEYYKGVSVETESLREYPEKGLFSHILGYIRGMSEEEYDTYKYYVYKEDKETEQKIIQKSEAEPSNDEKIYAKSDIVGKAGIEKAFEVDLNGIDGKKYVEVDVSGRTINTLNGGTDAVPGKKIYLTIDRDLQEIAQNAIIEELKTTLLSKLTSTSSIKDLFVSMVKGNKIPIENIWNSSEDSYHYIAKTAMLERDFDYELNNKDNENKEYGKALLCDAIKANQVSLKTMTLILYEQGMITGDEDFIRRLENGIVSPLTVIRDKISNNEITPQDTALDPCTGSVTVADIKTGKILVLASYPTYDNNELVNNFNNEYYNKLLSDPTSPMLNRPTTERKPPGSTFKMVPAVAFLKSGVVGPKETIYAKGTFDKAGRPAASCWLWNQRRGMHGSINITKALEVSCNYFFYEAAYRMGNAHSENRLQGIETLNEYIAMFGLDKVAGLEIGEASPINPTPEYKEIAEKRLNPDASDSYLRWNDGDTIRAAIGQSYNTYTTTHMAKYVATLANGGNRYKSTLIDKIEDSYGNIEYNEPVLEEQLNIEQEYLDVIYEGMHNVIRGTNGTLTYKFKDYPIEIAGKSGTAQDVKNKPDNTWFVGYAPYEDPQISIAVVIPFGDYNNNAPAAEISKTVISAYMESNSNAETKTMNNILSK